MTDHQPAAPKKTAPKKKRRLLKYTLGGIVLLLGAAAGGAYWLVGTESGLRFAAFGLPQYAGINTAGTVSGSIWGGFSARNLRVGTPSADIEISSLDFRWQPRELWHVHLHINEISAGNVHFQSKPTPPEPEKAYTPKEPDSLTLPLSVALDKLAVASLTQGKKKTEILRDARLAYAYDHKQHRLSLGSLKTYWANTDGTFSIDAVKPFTMQGAVHAAGELDGIAAQGTAFATGNLSDFKFAADLSSKDVGLHIGTRIRPYAATPAELISETEAQAHNLNPKAFMPNLPQAALSLTLAVRAHAEPGISDTLSGQLNLYNSKPLPADQGGIPVRTLNGSFRLDGQENIVIDHLLAKLLNKGSLNLSGKILTGENKLDLAADIKNLTVSDIASAASAIETNGSLNAKGTFASPEIGWQLAAGRAQSTGSLKIKTDTRNAQRTLLLENGTVKTENGGQINLSGSLELFQNQKLAAEIESRSFNPAKLHPALPEGSISGHIKAAGELAKQAVRTEIQLAPSTLSGAPLSGSGTVDYQNAHLSRADTAIRLGNNLISTKGAFGKRGDTLALDINAPDLGRFGFGLKGLLTAKGSLKNTADGFAKLEADLAGQARGFALGDALHVQTLDFKAKASPDPAAPLNLTLSGSGISAGGTAIDKISALLDGTRQQHRLRAEGSLKIDGKPLNLTLAANGGLTGQNQWQGSIGELNIAGALNLKLQNAMRLDAGAERVNLGAASWHALGGSLRLEQLTWSKQAGLVSKGRADNLHLEQLHNFYTPPVQHNLVIAADWDLGYTQSPRGYFNLRQQGGDITLPTPRKQPLGLQDFVLNTTLDGRGIHNRVAAGTRYGKISGDYNIMQAFGGGKITAAPVSGSIRIEANELDTFKSMMPVGQIIKGHLSAAAQINGTVSAPKLSGTIDGENLYYRNRQVGIILDNGSLKSRLDGQKWTIDALSFHRKDGSISLSGSAAYENGEPAVSAKLTVSRYPILDQPSRRLAISGSADVGYSGKGLTLAGSLKADEGRFGFQESSAPELDSDVIVIGETKPPPAPPMPLALNLDIDLGDNVRFAGEGISLLLGGKLALTSHNTSDVQAVGSIRITKGQYKAYGQDLVVKKGIISFVGPLTKPNLNIRAERRSSPVGAGVEVLGNLDAPRITLVADEPMSEKDKLSWLVLNRASSGSSTDEAALATAASAYLAGKFNDKLGLVDDFGLTSKQTRNADTGEMNPAQQVITFGKQLTQNLYLGYEIGLGQADQTVKLVYQLSRAFQAIARLGTISSGGELKYIKRFD